LDHLTTEYITNALSLTTRQTDGDRQTDGQTDRQIESYGQSERERYRQQVGDDGDTPHVCSEADVLIVDHFWSDELRCAKHHLYHHNTTTTTTTTIIIISNVRRTLDIKEFSAVEVM